MPHPFADLGNPIIDALGAPNAIQVEQYGAGSYSATTGLWVSGPVDVVSIDAVVQSSTPKEVEALPENERTKEAITVYTREPIKTSDVQDAEQSQVIRWHGRRFKVHVSEDWSDQAGYYRTVATRLGE